MKDFIIAVDDKNMRVYDTKAKRIMRIPDDVERMQEIGRLIQRISDDWPCVIDIERHYKRYKGKVLPKDLSIVSQYQWEDYVNNEPSVCSGGFPIGFDLADEYGNFKTWYGEEPPPQALYRIWEQLANDPMWHDPTEWNENTDKLCRLLTALQTEYEVLKMSGIVPPQPVQFVMDIRLKSDRARAMFEKFADEGYIEIVEGGHYKWLVTTRNKKALFGYWLEQAAIHCGIYEPNGKISRLPFERLFDIYDTARNTDQVPQPKGHKEIDRIFDSLQ